MKAIEEKVESYYYFSAILKVFFNTFFSNWGAFLEMWNNQKKIEHNYFKMKPVFDKTREFLERNDVYGAEKLVETFMVSYKPQTLT